MVDVTDDDCTDRTMFFWLFGFYTAWMMGIAALAYQKLKGFDDYATHFVGRKDYGVFVMMLTMFASWISGHTVTNVPNISSGLGYSSFWFLPLYCYCVLGWSWLAPRIRRLSVARQWNSYSDVFADRCRNPFLIYTIIIYPLASLEGYIIAQQWALRALMPVVSDYMMHDDRMTLLLTMVVYICESFGGFDAVSYTDVIQGCIMIMAICIGPAYMSGHFGALSGSVEFNCAGTWFETVVDPDDENMTLVKRRGCMSYRSPWNVLHPAGITYSYFFKPLWPTYGVDGSLYFNNLCIFIVNLWTYITSYNCYPHTTVRVFASKSDFHCRRSIASLSFLSLTAGTPGLMLGFFFAIHIERMYPAGTVTFGAILDFMMRQGGAAEFFACLAACGGVAGIMSTIDSCALASTNIVTKELVVNGIFRYWPHLDTHRFMTICERSSTGMILVIGLYFTIIFMPAKIESDPLEAKLIMNRIGFYQMGLIAQSFPSTFMILYGPIAKPVPMILGNLSSLIILPSLSIAFFEQKYYASNVPEAPTDLWFHPVVISVAINAFIMIVCSKVLPEAVANAFTLKGEKAPLTYDQILKIMENTVETIHSPLGRVTYVALILSTVMTCPWYGKSFNGCDVNTYAEHNEWIVDSSLPKPPDCDPEPPSPCGSFAAFGGAMMAGAMIAHPLSSVLFYAWKPDPTAGLAIVEQNPVPGEDDKQV